MPCGPGDCRSLVRALGGVVGQQIEPQAPEALLAEHREGVEPFLRERRHGLCLAERQGLSRRACRAANHWATVLGDHERRIPACAVFLMREAPADAR